MYEVPTDTYQDTQQFTAQPNTEAPIVAVNPYQYQGQGNQYQWVSLRLIFGGLGAIALLVIGAIAMRSTAISTDQVIKVAPLQNNLAPSTQQVNQVILENSKASLSDIKIATDLKIEEVTKAMLNERSQAILTEANRQIADKNSNCFRSPYQQACFISTFIPEQQKRYESAALSRDWVKANQALFEIKAARIALDGASTVPFTPNITSAAIIKEMEARVSILQQSDNAIAAEMFGGRQ
jgi:hypothetical protein